MSSEPTFGLQLRHLLPARDADGNLLQPTAQGLRVVEPVLEPVPEVPSD